MSNVLVIAAHPDDETLGCGGTIAKHTAGGDTVFVLFLAEGVTARYQSAEIDNPKVAALSQRRNENAIRALATLGVSNDAVTLSTRLSCRLDGEPQIDLVKDIERALHNVEPDIVYTHAAHDVNVDHRIAHQSTLAACRPRAGSQPRAIYAFEVLSSTEWNPAHPFAGTAFQDISPYIDAKVTALAAYEDEMREMPHPRSEAAVRGLATFRGVQAGVPFAEAFQVIRALNW